MQLISKIKESFQSLYRSPSNPGPRIWVRFFLSPFNSFKGKKVKISRRARLDIFPDRIFYIGDHSEIEEYCTINNNFGNVVIGENTEIGRTSAIFGPASIGKSVKLEEGVIIAGSDPGYSYIKLSRSVKKADGLSIYIGNGTSVGSGSLILPGTFIGNFCMIAPGTVVSADIPSYSFVSGDPLNIKPIFPKGAENEINLNYP